MNNPSAEAILINQINQLIDVISTMYSDRTDTSKPVVYERTKTNSAEQHKRELLQRDQNLAEDEAKLVEHIRCADEDLSDLRKEIQKIAGIKGNLIKKLGAIRNERQQIHREWIENYSNR